MQIDVQGGSIASDGKQHLFWIDKYGRVVRYDLDSHTNTIIVQNIGNWTASVPDETYRYQDLQYYKDHICFNNDACIYFIPASIVSHDLSRIKTIRVPDLTSHFYIQSDCIFVLLKKEINGKNYILYNIHGHAIHSCKLKNCNGDETFVVDSWKRLHVVNMYNQVDVYSYLGEYLFQYALFPDRPSVGKMDIYMSPDETIYLHHNGSKWVFQFR